MKYRQILTLLRRLVWMLQCSTILLPSEEEHDYGSKGFFQKTFSLYPCQALARTWFNIVGLVTWFYCHIWHQQ